MEKTTYDELVELKQQGQIGWKEFVLRSDFAADYAQWLDENGLSASDESAGKFLDAAEDFFYAAQQLNPGSNEDY